MMEELDLLKKDWKKNSYQQISEVDIYKMLHKKSSSIVKWILIISLLELFLWTSIGLLFNTDDYLKKMHSEYLIEYIKYINLFNYVVIAVFIYMFYKNYRAISTITSTKQLMKDILKTRKTVKYYVYYNLAMMVVSTIFGFVLGITTNPKVQQVTSNGKTFAILLAFCFIALLVIFGIVWLFYWLLYGTLLKKLFRNYNELKKIDL